MKSFFAVLIAITLVGLGVIGFAYSGFYDVSASSVHTGLVRWLLSTTSHASIARRATDVEVPDLSDEAIARAGVNDFAAMCTGCHGAPGQAPEAMGQGLNPSPPDLAESAARMSAAELFWATKHGIKMTGMPAWGATHDDDAIWPVVAFVTSLPELDEEGYQALLASADGMGHHAGDDGHGDHEHGSNGASPAPTDHGHDHDGDTSKASEPHNRGTRSHDVPTAQPEEQSHDAHEH